MARSQLRNRARKELESGDLSGRLVTVLDPFGAASEDYRTLRTNLMYTLVDTPPKVIVVTSPGPAEGKSTTCANLGVALSQADKSTLVVDCDLRKPAMHKIFGLRNLRGVVNVLAGEFTPQEVYQEPVEGLKAITTGSLPPNPVELLGSRRFAEFVNEVRQEFDYVLVDVPPTGMISDAAVAAAQGDGVLLVFDSQNTRKGAVRRSVSNLEALGANVLGTVMNNAEASKGDRPYEDGSVY